MVETMEMSPDYYDMESMVHADTRSFILKKPTLSEEIVVTPNQESGMETVDALRVLSGHLMQTRDLVQPDKPASLKFIVTLDGVPSPPEYMSVGRGWPLHNLLEHSIAPSPLMLIRR
ncbi:zinc finger protein CCCH domain-containing protein 14 isoform X1 [Sigmodon hispidus]